MTPTLSSQSPSTTTIASSASQLSTVVFGEAGPTSTSFSATSFGPTIPLTATGTSATAQIPVEQLR